MSSEDSLKELVSGFPASPGVYLMKNQVGKIIYVGKAKNLRSRVKSYFQDSKDLSPKTRLLVSHIRSVEFVVTQNEVEAFLLEASLIKKHKPRYNIRLKDDKAYPYIRISMADDFPRLYLARSVKKDGSLYFGPYTSGKSVWQTINFLNQTFKIRDCSDHFMKSRERPCLTHQIGRCDAPCVGLIDRDSYRKNIQGAIEFLKGKNKKILKDLKIKMEEASEKENYESAAKFRDSIFAIQNILEKQTVVSNKQDLDQDAVSFFGDARGVNIEVLISRSGRVLGSRSHFLSQINLEEDSQGEWMLSFLNQYYENNLIPDEILVATKFSPEIQEVFKEVLQERSGRKIQISYADPDGKDPLMSLSLENAKQHFEDLVAGNAKKMEALEEIQKRLHLLQLPLRMECFDISHFQGSETVASQVVFEDGVPNKNLYRKYKIKSVDGVDDYKSMREVLTRRLSNEEMEDPHLILIDGGKGQLNVVSAVLKDLGREDLKIASIAEAKTQRGFQKETVERTEERFFLPGRSNPVTFKTQSEAFKILTFLRDEAHRFAVAYHVQRRESLSLKSELDDVPGLGPKRKQALLAHFESVDQIREASVAEISALEGITEKLAEKILESLKS